MAMNFTNDPAWPWSSPAVGLPALAVVAALLIGLTIWTYIGVRGATVRRVSIVLVLRLLALLLVLLAVLRPSFAFRDAKHTPSLLLIAVDGTESMTIQDMFGGQSRWNALLNTLGSCEKQLQPLRDEQNVNVLFFRFGGDVREFDPQSPGEADAKRSDYGELLHWLHDRYRTERFLRGLVILGDGAHNGLREDPLKWAPQWRNLPCPIHTVGYGKPTTSEKQNDIAVTSIVVEPSVVRVKSEMTVRASVDAPGFVNAKVQVELWIDNEKKAAKEESLRLTTGNSVQLKCPTPLDPSEVKVTLKVLPLPNETITSNNEMSTFVNVSKEGLSVLVVDKELERTPFITRALANEPRIFVRSVMLRGDIPANPEQVDLFQFEKQHYDVIILGDVSAKRLRTGNPKAIENISDQVREKRTGLMMIGGVNSFGGSDWQGTELAKLLPVDLSESRLIDANTKLVPLDEGLRYLLRLGDTVENSKKLWQKMAPLRSMSTLGKPVQGRSTVFAAANDPTGLPLLVGHDVGRGRILAFAGEETKYWIKPDVTRGPHDTFWKRCVLWLAHQEEMEGTVWVKLDARRLAAGDKLPFQVGLRGKGGEDRPDGKYEVKVFDPAGVETIVPTTRDKSEDRGMFWKTDTAGEYRIEVNGVGKDADGKDITGKATARFLVYEDDAEMRQRAANHDFLKALATAGGGEFHLPDDLAGFLAQLQSQPLPHSAAKADLWPEWRRNQPRPSGFLVAFFLLFVTVLSLEWLLRRRWGLV
jgi:uncharacterized membrane protein